MAACRRTGSVRPTTGPVKRDRHCHVLLRHKRKPPRGMYINHDDLVAMAAGPPAPAPASQGDQMLKAMDREIVSLKRQVSLFLSLMFTHDERFVGYVSLPTCTNSECSNGPLLFCTCTPVSVEMFYSLFHMSCRPLLIHTFA